ncbi:MAG: MFS transporter [Armatimonadota bacterium]
MHVVSAYFTLARRGTRDLRLLAFTMFSAMFGFGALTAAYSNFAVQALRLGPREIGIVESSRELPGFLIFAVAALTMRLAEPVLASISLWLVAGGVAAYAVVGGMPSLIVFSIIWSTGLHAWMTLQPAMTLALSDEHSRGKRLGQMSGAASLGMVCGMGLVLLVGRQIGFASIFLASSVWIAAGAVSVSRISREIGHLEKPRLVFKRRYSRYYLLTLLDGCRRQVFATFAIFVLVRSYGTPLAWVAGLMIVNSLANMLLAPKVGRLIDRIGERKVLTACYGTLILVFLGYAVIRSRELLFLLYLIDNSLFLGSMALSTYLHKIAKPADLMPSLAMGVSMNHIAAVAVPIVGGLLWARFDYPVIFIGGAAVAAVSVLASTRLQVASE